MFVKPLSVEENIIQKDNSRKILKDRFYGQNLPSPLENLGLFERLGNVVGDPVVTKGQLDF